VGGDLEGGILREVGGQLFGSFFRMGGIGSLEGGLRGWMEEEGQEKESGELAVINRKFLPSFSFSRNSDGRGDFDGGEVELRDWS